MGYIWKYKEIDNTIIQEDKKVGKKIIQYDMNNNKINEFNSIREAARDTQFPRSSIISNLQGKSKHAKGFIWKYST